MEEYDLGYNCVVPKYSFVCLMVLLNKLPTYDKLFSWGFVVSSTCVLCGSVEESRDHVFSPMVSLNRYGRYCCRSAG